jgi:hypothetical protein
MPLQSKRGEGQMTSSILMMAFLSVPTFLSCSALLRLSGMQKAAAGSVRGGFDHKSASNL